MDYKKLMMDSLSGMLEEGETLRYPFYGSLIKGELAYFGFFGLTETALLVAILGRGTEEISSYNRIPLNIEKVRIKKNVLPTRYKVSIFTKENTFCQLQVFRKVVRIDCQRESVDGFIQYLNRFPSV